jgi:hypothetical protein
MNPRRPEKLGLLSLFHLLPANAAAAELEIHTLDLTGNWVGFLSIGIFLLAYLFVMAEEYTHLLKSKPVIIGAGVIWGVIAYVYASHDMPVAAGDVVHYNLLEYVELMLFLLGAMTYINTMRSGAYSMPSGPG